MQDEFTVHATPVDALLALSIVGRDCMRTIGRTILRGPITKAERTTDGDGIAITCGWTAFSEHGRPWKACVHWGIHAENFWSGRVTNLAVRSDGAIDVAQHGPLSVRIAPPEETLDRAAVDTETARCDGDGCTAHSPRTAPLPT